MSSITAKSTIKCLQSIFAQFGLPERVVTDNGPTFVSAEFKDFLQRNRVTHTTTSPYHPSSNGLAERAIQTLKNGLRKLIEPHYKAPQVCPLLNCCLDVN